MTARSLGTAAVLALLCPSVARAAEPTQAQCLSAYETVQLERQRGHLVSARDSAVVCAHASCPDVARKDCETWAVDLARAVPTVVVTVRDEATGEDRPARILVDGTPRPDASSGRPFELDPGSHVFRLEPPSGPLVEQTISVVQGERDRPLRFTLAAATQPPRHPPDRVPPPLTLQRPVTYAPAVVTGSAAVVLLGVSGFLGLTGRSDLSTLRATCAPTCTDAQVSPVRTKLTASDITLAVGAAAALVSIYLFARPPSSGQSAAARLDVTPTAFGGSVSFHTGF